MNNETILIALVVAGITCGLFPLFLILLRRPETAIDVSGTGEDEPAFGALTGPLAAQIPLTESGKDDVQKLLLGAGYYHKTALLEYRAVRVALTIAPLFITGAIALIVPPERLTTTLVGGLIAALVGFSLPRVYLGWKRRQRAREISRGLPLTIDLLTLCLTAGQSLLAAFRHVAGELRNSNPVLSQELAITARQAELHTLDVAVKQWADRVQVPEVSNLSSLIVQSDKLGTDTADTLSELSTNFRTSARQRAETQANRTSFWMLFPSVFCFWVAAAIILIGPAYLEFFEYRQRAGGQLINQTRSNIDRANRRTRPVVDPLNPGAAPVEVPGAAGNP
ncbi:MAG: type II secretion system F family protein [Gemmataceae bacterium]|nr:type II secretion system F family protein [Gemmataceae bacterium]